MLAVLRHRAQSASDAAVRYSAVRELVAQSFDDPETLAWLKTLAQTESDFAVACATANAIVDHWSHDPTTLTWFKTYAQYGKSPAVRAAAAQALARGWKDEFNVFEILYKCAIGDPFDALRDEGVNPRQVALKVMLDYYPGDAKVAFLLSDRAENDADVEVRRFARSRMNRCAA